MGEGSSRSSRPSQRTEDPRYYEALGRAIKVARTELGLERKELAERSGLSYAYLSDIESGRGRPSSKALRAIAEALGVAPSLLLGSAEARVSRPPSTPPSDERWATWERPSAPMTMPSLEEAGTLRTQLRMVVDELDPADVPVVLELVRRLIGR